MSVFPSKIAHILSIISIPIDTIEMIRIRYIVGILPYFKSVGVIIQASEAVGR
jgi:hypothetical protein